MHTYIYIYIYSIVFDIILCYEVSGGYLYFAGRVGDAILFVQTEVSKAQANNPHNNTTDNNTSKNDNENSNEEYSSSRPRSPKPRRPEDDIL